MTIWYGLMGLAAGILGGAFGIGGGALMVPVMIVLLGVPVHVAFGTSLAVIVPLAFAGALRHLSLGNVNWQIVLPAAVGGIIGSVAGATLIEKVPAIYAKRAMAVFLVYSAFRMWTSK
ncbi:MAG TPA: sulfite exporter TauE/SafE family protein [Bacteroidetes bacterium]|nr:sulfite exporter TauE/SafE family protein [Bacteroidota bacterium]